MDVTVIERKDRDNGTSHMWVACDGERSRFSIDTKTLDSPEGHSILVLMASKAASLAKTARERGKLRLED